MLHQFLSNNRLELINRCREKVAQRNAPRVTAQEMENGIPLFLDQLIQTLEIEQTIDPMQSRLVSGEAGGDQSALSPLGEAAALHGQELLRQGFTIEQVVHDYGDLCQAVTDLAFELRAPIAIDEFRTLNRCLDNGIADAVTAFNRQRDINVADQQAEDLNERLGMFAHELRNMLSNATLALSAIKAGNVGLHGATGAILDRSLVSMNDLINRSLAEVRMTAEVPVRHRLFSLDKFIAEIRVVGALQSQLKDCTLTVSPIDPLLAVSADRDLLFSAVGNLLQNAFKFTHPQTEVSLNAYARDNRIFIEVADQGDGLKPGEAETMFQPFTQGGKDRSGLGLGLSISRRSVEANDGILTVRDKPDAGCIFTIDLPRYSVVA